MSSVEPNNGSVPLIPIQNRRQYSRVDYDQEHDADDDRDHFHHQGAYHDPGMRHGVDTSYPGSSYNPPDNHNMARTHIAAQLRPRKGSSKSAIIVIASYAFDWIIIIVALGISYLMGNQRPNMRHFSLEDPNIS
jgi:hypothetical protein